MKQFMIIIAVSSVLNLALGVNYTPVENFSIGRFLGTWYEIARLPAWFEKDMENVTSTYTLKNDKTISVNNKGTLKGAPKLSKGVATFAKDTTVGHLRLSFFGPFYSNYTIFYVDSNYTHALVATDDKYLWIFSRTQSIDKPTLDRLLGLCTEAGFDISKLQFTYSSK